MKTDPEKEKSNTFELKAILVVDDDQQLASALQWILADANFLVDVAFDGEEAILKVKAHEYDAVICDSKMPKLRGAALLWWKTKWSFWSSRSRSKA